MDPADKHDYSASCSSRDCASLSPSCRRRAALSERWRFLPSSPPAEASAAGCRLSQDDAGAATQRKHALTLLWERTRRRAVFTVVGCRSLQDTLYLCPCPPFPPPPRALRKEAHMLEHTVIRRAVAQRGTGRGWLCKVSARAKPRAAAGHLFSACTARHGTARDGTGRRSSCSRDTPSE